MKTLTIRLPGETAKRVDAAAKELGISPEHLVESSVTEKLDRLEYFIRSRVVDVMRLHGVVRAGIFGSVARGEATESSDVDFLVEFEPGRSLLDLAGLRLDLEEVLERSVDVATRNSLRPELRDQIFAEVVPLL